MGDFQFNNTPSVSRIDSDNYVIDTSPSLGVFYPNTTEGNISNTKMQDDCLTKQAGKQLTPRSTGGKELSDDVQAQQLQKQQQPTVSEEGIASGVNGDVSLSGLGTSVPGSSSSPSGQMPPNSQVSPSLVSPGSGNASAISSVSVAHQISAGVVGGPVTGVSNVSSSGLVESVTLASTLATSVASLWSTPTVDDSLLTSSIPNSINGTYAFSNLGHTGGPGGGGALFNSSLGHQLLGPSGQNPVPGGQRKPANPSGSPSFPPARPQSLSTTPPGSFCKGYSSAWSSGVNSQAWSPGPSPPQANTGGHGPGNPPLNTSGSLPGMSSWQSRGRAVGNSMAGINPLSHGIPGVSAQPLRSSHGHAKLTPNPMLMTKYRRSTSFPGKGPFPQPPTFEITGVDDSGFSRDLHHFQQGSCMLQDRPDTSILEHTSSLQKSSYLHEMSVWAFL